MQNFWSTTFFWIAFGTISSLVLRYFYFSKNATLLRRLRFTAGLLETVVLVLLLFPWFPGAHGYSGWGLVLQGNDAGMTILTILLVFTTASLLFKKQSLFKAGAISHFIATPLMFGLMIKMMPGTVKLTMGDTAPIFAVFILLINNVVLLLLWNQLQKIKE